MRSPQICGLRSVAFTTAQKHCTAVAGQIRSKLAVNELLTNLLSGCTMAQILILDPRAEECDLEITIPATMIAFEDALRIAAAVENKPDHIAGAAGSAAAASAAAGGLGSRRQEVLASFTAEQVTHGW